MILRNSKIGFSNKRLVVFVCVISCFIGMSWQYGTGSEKRTISLPMNPRTRGLSGLHPHYRGLRPVIGLVLSGGGARGIAHIGVLSVLEDNNIPIDCIAGTSMGSIVGGLYASGYSAREIKQLLSGVLWQELVEDKPQRTSLLLSQKQVRNRQFIQFRLRGLKPHIPPAISPGQKLYNELSRFILQAPYHTKNGFDELKIPFRSVATDLVSGRKIVFETGDLAQIMLASSAIPLLFAPVSIDSLLLIDGGVLENIPVEEVKSFDPDLIIAVDTTSPLRPAEKILLPWQLADQVTTIMQVYQREQSRQQADILITPKLNSRTNTDFDSLEKAYLAGIYASESVLPQIRSAMNRFRLPLSNLTAEGFRVADVRVVGGSLGELNGLTPHKGMFLTEIETYEFLGSLYDSGIIDTLSASIQERNENDESTVNFYLKLYPILKSINFHHNSQIFDSLLMAALENSVGHRFNVHLWQKDRERILKLYRQKGFSLARIVTEKLDSHSGALEIFIDEGKIETVNLTGNKRTRSSVVFREYPLKPGDFFRDFLSEQGATHIYSTGLFDRVQQEYVWKNEKLHVNLRVWEKPFSQVSLSYNMSREDQFQSFLQWAEENPLGFGNRFSITGIAGTRRVAAELSIQSDRVFNTYLSSLLRAFYWQRKRYAFENNDISGEYKEKRVGFHFSIGQQLRRAGLLLSQLQVERVNISPVFGSGFPDSRDNKISLRLQWIVDSLDKLPFPKKGRYNLFFYEVSPKFFGNKNSYFLLYSRFESYYTFFRRWTVSPKIIWGAAENTTPFSEFFILGSNESFFGFRQNEMRGRRLIQSSFELRYFMPSRLPLDIYFTLRYDLGAIWKDSADEIVWDEFIHGFGGKISFDSILGDFSFGYGENSSGGKEFTFNLGFNF